MDGVSQMCRCGDAVRVFEDGTRITLINGRPHLDHTAYIPWMESHGFTAGRLDWFIDVVDYPGSIRDQLVSPRLLWACGLIPGIDWSTFRQWDGRLITTAGQQPHHSGYPDVEQEPETPTEPPDVPQGERNAPPEPTGSDEPVHQPSVVKRFGTTETTKTPGRSAADRWSR